MTAVLVHGAPDTERVWHAVRSRLVERIAARGEPVDLVGHDWGAILALRAACLRPDLVRSWAAGSGPLDAEYVWHKTARLWQTPEQLMTKLAAPALEKGLVAEGAGRSRSAQSGVPIWGD